MKKLTLKKLILSGLPVIFTTGAYAHDVTLADNVVSPQIQQAQITAASQRYVQLQESASIASRGPGSIPHEPPQS